jgi:hypothetical protein
VGARYGTNCWTKCTPGDLPVVIRVPHGGSLAPPERPNRVRGLTTADMSKSLLRRAVFRACARTRNGPFIETPSFSSSS